MSDRQTAEVLRSLPTEEQQGIALFLSHGVADAGTTVLASAALGPGAEGNPIMRAALEHGFGFAAGIMLAVVGAIAVTYPTLARVGGFPDWFGWGLVVVGLVVSLGNLWVVLA